MSTNSLDHHSLNTISEECENEKFDKETDYST